MGLAGGQRGALEKLVVRTYKTIALHVQTGNPCEISTHFTSKCCVVCIWKHTSFSQCPYVSYADDMKLCSAKDRHK